MAVRPYLISLPERILRSASLLAAGILREASGIALPASVRRTRLYRNLVDSTLRFIIEEIGQVKDAYPDEAKLAEDFLLRRTAGNGIELAGILAFRASPVWVLAALADLSGAGRDLIREIAEELKRAGLLDPSADVTTMEQMLVGLERGAGRLAEACNMPPLNVKDLRAEWNALRADVAGMPVPRLPGLDSIRQSWNELKEEASAQRRSVFEVSSLMALSAVRWLGKSATIASRRTGEIFAGGLLRHYHTALREMHETGYMKYWIREFRPYLRGALLHFSPKRVTITERLMRRSLAAALCLLWAAGSVAAERPGRPATWAPPPISPAALRAHVSFLASDALRGRQTPGWGGDIAAEYIASEFRAAGLEEGLAGYFQITSWLIEFRAGGDVVRVQPGQIIGSVPPDLLLFGMRAVVTTPAEWANWKEKRPRFAFVVTKDTAEPVPGVVVIRSPELLALRDKAQQQNQPLRVTFIPPGLKNVVGIVRGTTDEYVVLSAHYDHIGVRPDGEGDRIFNGANDNASSVSALIEVAAALQKSKQKPRRSIVFLAFFGEEEGLVGSRYYARYPVFPIPETMAQLNLEQLGRIDDETGPRARAVTLTGFRYSNLPGILAHSTPATGVRVQDPGKEGDDYFVRSDNESLALAGVPAHTLSVAFEFPDYHKVSDEWPKLDYENMAIVTRFITAGVWDLANRAAPPQWDETNQEARKFAEARRATRPGESRAASARGDGSSPASRLPQPRKPSTVH